MTHGTYGGYQRHRKDRTPPCDACLAAYRAYMANYRRPKQLSLPEWCADLLDVDHGISGGCHV